MLTSGSLNAGLQYIRRLSDAVVDGIGSASNGRQIVPRLTACVWAPAAIGAAIGAVLTRRPRSSHRMAMGGLAGSALGLGAGMAWASRDLARSVARSAIQNVNTVRDARWLEKNPINYA